MSEARDLLEAELSALTPQPVSPELRRRVAERLAEPAPAERHWQRRILGLAGLAACCLLALSLRWQGGRGIETRPVEFESRHAPSAAVLRTGPTLFVYEHALARSPEDLEALLAEDAVIVRVLDRGPTRVSDFTRSAASLETLLGGY